MFKKVLALILVTIVAFTLVLTGCSGTAKDESDKSAGTDAGKNTGSDAGKNDGAKDIKVGFVFIGPVNDGGWTQAHDNARKYLEEQLGVKTAYKESVPEGPDSAKVIKDLIDQGCNVIFTTSFGYMDPTIEVAKEFPEVKFFHCSGFKTAENVSTYFGRIYEPRYLSGIVAGLKTKANKIGYVAAFELPEVIRGINAFTLGVQSVNPDAKVIVRWSHTWIDVSAEKNAAVALLDEGCDVITQHNDSTAPQLAAEERGAFAIGYDLDARDVATKAYMTAPIFNWGPYYVNEVKAIMDGTWKSTSYWGGLSDGVVDLAPLTENAPAEAGAKVDEARKQIEDESLEIFKGPIKDQTGAVKVEEGKVMTDDEVWNMDWFVEGVEGKIEKQ